MDSTITAIYCQTHEEESALAISEYLLSGALDFSALMSAATLAALRFAKDRFVSANVDQLMRSLYGDWVEAISLTATLSEFEANGYVQQVRSNLRAQYSLTAKGALYLDSQRARFLDELYQLESTINTALALFDAKKEAASSAFSASLHLSFSAANILYVLDVRKPLWLSADEISNALCLLYQRHWRIPQSVIRPRLAIMAHQDLISLRPNDGASDFCYAITPCGTAVLSDCFSYTSDFKTQLRKQLQACTTTIRLLERDRVLH